MDGAPGYTKTTVMFGLILTAIAGMVDVVGYLMLSHILPANMSGNTVEGALSWTHGEMAGTSRRLWAVVSFVFGAVVSASLHEWAKRRKLRSPASIALLLEVVLLMGWVVCANLWSRDLAARPEVFGIRYFATLTLATVSMGVQNASLTRVGPVHAFTTHVTGTITKLAESWVESAFWLKDQLRHFPEAGLRRTLRKAAKLHSTQSLWIMSALWLAFFAGALLAGPLIRHWGIDVLVFPAIALSGLAAWSAVRPLGGGN
jgi:uncharacterized membrane protein YoaK (UPF0700 family)